jgi:hypothetical protein
LEEAHKSQEESMSAARNMGWAKIAWSFGLKFLIYLSRGTIKLEEKDIYK